jgi:hypothetical protein
MSMMIHELAQRLSWKASNIFRAVTNEEGDVAVAKDGDNYALRFFHPKGLDFTISINGRGTDEQKYVKPIVEEILKIIS